MGAFLNEAILKGTTVSVDMDEASPDVCRSPSHPLNTQIKHFACLFLSLTALQERLESIKHSHRLETPWGQGFHPLTPYIYIYIYIHTHTHTIYRESNIYLHIHIDIHTFI